MQDNPEFKRAVAAAKEGPEAFDKVLKDIEIHFEQGEAGVQFLLAFIKEKISENDVIALLDVLIKHGIDLNIEIAYEDITTLSIAAASYMKDVVNFLIKNHADVNYPPSRPPLCFVINNEDEEDDRDNENNRLEMVKLLVEGGANVNAQNEDDITPLGMAVNSQYPEIVKYLLSKGATLLQESRGTLTTLGFAHNGLTHMYGSDTAKVTHATECFDLLIHAAKDYLYQEGLRRSNEAVFIQETIEKLVGNFYISPFNNSEVLKYNLTEYVKPEELVAQIKAEKFEKTRTFCRGSIVRQGRDMSPLCKFFHNGGQYNLTREIFSFVHQVGKPKMG